MADFSAIKTVALGGYDKGDTEKLLEAMEQRLAELSAAAASEKSRADRLQEENNALSLKNKELSDEIGDLEKKLSDANDDAGNRKSAFEKSRAFIEAQKSSDMILEKSRSEAENIRKDAVRLAEEIISEADENAAKIVEEANEKAERIISEARENADDVNQKFSECNGMNENISRLAEQLDSLKALYRQFESDSLEHIEQCGKIISEFGIDTKNNENSEISTEEVINSDSEYQPMFVEKIDDETAKNADDIPTDTKDEEKRSDDLDMLMAMAEALNDD